VLNCSVIDKRGGESVRDSVGRIVMSEPDDRWKGDPIQPATTTITISGQRVNADGTVMLQLPTNVQPPARDVAPMIDGITWYMWELTLGQPHLVRMTWSRHPQAGSGDVQVKFDEGARLLAKDDDDLVANPTDPQDDVPAYLEFLIIRAAQNVFPADWVGSQYNNVIGEVNIGALLTQQFANIKLVTSIWRYVNNTWVDCAGVSTPGLPSILFRVSGLDGVVAMHEYGHRAGLSERDPDSPDAIMRSIYNSQADEVNATESSYYTSYTPALWNGN